MDRSLNEKSRWQKHLAELDAASARTDARLLPMQLNALANDFIQRNEPPGIPAPTYRAAQDAYQQQVKGVLARAHPAAREQLLARNRDLNEAVLNSLAFDTDPWARDALSKRGLQDMEFSTRVPLGMEDAYIHPAIRGTHMSSSPGHDVYLSGKSVQGDRFGSLPALLRHEGTHRAADLSEKQVRAMDQLYGEVNSDRDLVAAARGYTQEDRVSGQSQKGLMKALLAAGLVNSAPESPHTVGKRRLPERELEALPPEARLHIMATPQYYNDMRVSDGLGLFSKSAPKATLFSTLSDYWQGR